LDGANGLGGSSALERREEQGALDSLIADLLGTKASKDVETEAAAKTTPDFEIELEAAIANAFEGLSERDPSAAKAGESAKRVTTAATSVLEAALASVEVVPNASGSATAPAASGFEGTTAPAASGFEETTAPAGGFGGTTAPSASGLAGDVASVAGGFGNETRATVPPFSAELLNRPIEVESSPRFVMEPLRKRHIWPLFICAVIVFILLTGGLTYASRLVLAGQAEIRSATQREGSGYLDESIALIQEADIVVIALDRAIESQVREGDLPQLEALLEQVDDTQGSLDRAVEMAKRAQETFLEEDSRELARRAQEAAEYRKQMLDLSAELTSFDLAAMKSALSLEYAWSLIVDADAGMRAAVEVVAGGGANAVGQSRDYNEQALDKLVLAGEMLTVTATTFPTTDLQLLNEYLAAKRASAELALASDDAFLAGDYAGANAYNEEFIAMDAEAVRLAVGIPSDPLSLVVAAYEKAVSQLREDYKVVRSHAADADEHLRAYLGVDVQEPAGDQSGGSGDQGGGPEGQGGDSGGQGGGPGDQGVQGVQGSND
jgi:hypothetical protein